MSFEDTLARMRREATPEGEPELLVHLLSDWDSKQGLWGGFACDRSGELRVPLYQRTKTAERATCPDCLASLARDGAL